MNVRSLKNKLNELHHLLYNNRPTIILITESWLDNSVTDILLDPDNMYQIFRCDRLGKIGGGTCAFISRTLKSRQILLHPRLETLCKNISCDLLCFDIFTRAVSYKFILLYRPPGTLTKDVFRMHIVSLNTILKEIINTNITTILTGDFNLPGINWAKNIFPADGIHDLFVENTSSLGLHQLVTEPTRHSSTGNHNTLDLIFSSDPCAIVVTDCLPPFSTSDHSVIEFSTFLPNQGGPPVDTQPILLTVYDWSAGNYEAINEALNALDLHGLFGFHFEVNQMWNQFKKIIWPIIDQFIPKKAIIHTKKYKPKNYPKSIKLLLTRKAALWRTLKTSKSNIDLKQKYADIANKCKLAIYNFDFKKEQKLLEANNLGAFYKFANKKLSSPTGIAPLVDIYGNFCTSDAEKAKLLSDYFSSVYTIDNGVTPVFPSRLPPNTKGINDIPISTALIYKILKKLKTNSAAGPDNLPPIFYHNTAKTINFPLSILYRSFIDLHNIPDDWKQSIITPKFKKGSASDVTNYRPIALTCTACKILESLVSSALLDFFLLHNLISNHQHGFLKKHSTTTNLLSSLNDWTLSMHNHQSTVVAYIDFQRAFDAISHSKLIHKLIGYGVEGNLLSWIQSFLSNRSQSVRVHNSLSNYLKSTSGVPQGSVIGPLLFNLFINDITDLFDSSAAAKLFADDIKIYSQILLPPNKQNFQKYLDAVHTWADTWQIGISYSKCNFIEIGTHSFNQNFNISGNTILKSDIIKDLGVYVDKKLDFKAHIADLVMRARQRSALVFRGFLTRDSCNLIRAFLVYIRPLLEYASPVWSPSLIYLNDAIEKIQKSFTKRLSGFQNFTYHERLSKLKIQSLEHRRLMNDLVMCYNIIHGFTSLPFHDFFKLSSSTKTRGHSHRLDIPLVKCTIRRNFFNYRVIKPWNALPATVVNSNSTCSFKATLYKVDLSLFLKYPCILH